MQSYDVLYIVSLIKLFRQPAQLKEIRDALTLVWRHDIAYIVSLADKILVQLQIFHFVLALIATSGGDCAHHEGAVVNPRNVRMFRNHISRHLIKNKIELVVRLFIYFCLWTNEQSYLLFVNNNNAGLSTYSSSFWSFKYESLISTRRVTGIVDWPPCIFVLMKRRLLIKIEDLLTLSERVLDAFLTMFRQPDGAVLRLTSSPLNPTLMEFRRTMTHVSKKGRYPGAHSILEMFSTRRCEYIRKISIL